MACGLLVSGVMAYADIRRCLLRGAWCQMRVPSSKMRVFCFDRYIFRMKFPTGTGFTYRNLHSFARFPCDSTAFLLRARSVKLMDCFFHNFSSNVPFASGQISRVTNRTRLHPFARSWLYNATAVRGALWWLRKCHIVNYANHQHSPFARRWHDFRQAAARCFKLHFPRYRLVKVSWKSVQPFPRTVVSYFLRTEKKQKNKKTKKNICKTYTYIVPKISTICRNLTKFWQKLSLHSFFRHGVCTHTERTYMTHVCNICVHIWVMYALYMFIYVTV